MSAIVDTAPTAPAIKGRSLWADARRRFMHNKAAVVSTLILIAITLLCFGAPYLGLRSPDDVNWDLDPLASPPNWAEGYYFGSDANGRDLFVRTLFGG